MSRVALWAIEKLRLFWTSTQETGSLAQFCSNFGSPFNSNTKFAETFVSPCRARVPNLRRWRAKSSKMRRAWLRTWGGNRSKDLKSIPKHKGKWMIFFHKWLQRFHPCFNVLCFFFFRLLFPEDFLLALEAAGFMKWGGLFDGSITFGFQVPWFSILLSGERTFATGSRTYFHCAREGQDVSSFTGAIWT